MGIEIEICVEENFYNRLKMNGKLDNYSFSNIEKYKFSDDEVEFKGIDEGLKDVILTDDPSCDCSKFSKRRKKYINAEINSPALHKDELNKFYDKFLKNILFKDMEKINQGGTCGVHIHWSNSFLRDNKLSEINPNFLLEFIKIIDNFRRLNVRKIIKPEFSGREDIYTELEKGSNIIKISPIYSNYKNQIYRIKDLRIDLSKEKIFIVLRKDI